MPEPVPTPRDGGSVKRLTVAASYALSLAVLVAAVLLRWVLDPWMGDALPLVTLFGAVAGAVWIGGVRPAIVVGILGYLACAYLFLEPRGQVSLDEAREVIGLLAYLFTCALIIGFGEVTRRAQQRASEQREVLRVTLRSIGDAVITTDIDGRVTYLNAVAESLTGWTQADALGEPLEAVFRIVNEQTRQPVENPAARALRSGVVVGLANHTLLLRKNGGECPIDDSAAPISDEHDRVSGCVLIFRDVTAQRHMEQDKANQLMTARFLAAIIESSDDAIISKSLDGTIQSWNAAAERLFGYTAAQAVGRNISLVIPADRRAEEERIIASLKTGQRIEHFETERQRSDGQRLFVSLTVSPIKDESGHVIGASKIVRDVTERKRAQDTLAQLASELSDADRRKNEFLAMLAHELRNPLAPISNAARTLRLSGGDPQAVESASAMVERQVRQLSRLVDDLLDISRITRGRIELRREQVELGPIVQLAAEAARPLYKTMQHELTVTLPPEPVHLHADPARLTQVIGNLLNNAARYTPAGGRVSVIVTHDGGQAVIRIRDNGIGIAPANVHRVFDMFTQVDESHERTRDGLGIGLTLVKTLVELHGGTVDLRSEGLGAGTEFVVSLPALAPAPAPQPSAAAATVAPAVHRILVVDDNEDGAESMAMLLEFDGHETHKAYDGIAALEAVERLRPDVVLLDIGLPGLNGYEVCRRVRQEPWGKDLVLVALTGWGQAEDRQRSREAGFDAHVVKPVDHKVLATLIASLPRGTGTSSS